MLYCIEIMSYIIQKFQDIVVVEVEHFGECIMLQCIANNLSQFL